MNFEELRSCEVFRVNVTKKDISDGKVGAPCRCPIARAINRTLKLPTGSTWVSEPESFKPIEIRRQVENSLEASAIEYETVYMEHSPESGRFVAHFDDGRDVQPVTLNFKRFKP